MPDFVTIPSVVPGQTWTASEQNAQIKGNLDIGVPAVFTTGGDIYMGSGTQGGTLLSVGNVGEVPIARPDLGGTSAIVWGGGAVVSGMIAMYAGTAAPFGFFECNGAAVSRTTFAVLFSVTGTGYGQGDGSTTFNLPDLRGRFVRGWDHGAGVDPDAASRTAMATGGATGDNPGSIQGDAFKSHTHLIQDNILQYQSGSDKRRPGQDTGASDATGGNETRPKNANLMYIIKV